MSENAAVTSRAGDRTAPPPGSEQASVEPDDLEQELARLRRENRRRLRRRLAVIGVVLTTAAGVQWHRQIGLWATGHWYAAKAGGRTIDVEAALRKIAGGEVLVVDVRGLDEFAVSHLRGARSLPLSKLKKLGWPAEWRRDRPVIVYCTVGYRSGVAAGLLAQRGLDAENLVGGILALAQADQPLFDRSGQTWRVHTWSESLAWLVPPPYEAAWSK